MTMWEYLMESSAWSIAGLSLGYFLGRTEREVRALKRKDQDREIREAKKEDRHGDER